MTRLTTLQQDMDEFAEFLESLPHPPGNEVQQLTKAFRSALQGEGPARERGVKPPLTKRKPVHL